eukprot:PhM_4_TR12385/c0_g1_i1/m.61619
MAHANVRAVRHLLQEVDNAVDPTPDPARLVQVRKRTTLEDVVNQKRLHLKPRLAPTATSSTMFAKGNINNKNKNSKSAMHTTPHNNTVTIGSNGVRINPIGFRETNRYHHSVDLPHLGVELHVDSKLRDYTPHRPASSVSASLTEGNINLDVYHNTPKPDDYVTSALQDYTALKKNLLHAKFNADAFGVLPKQVVNAEPYLDYLRQSYSEAGDHTRVALQSCGIRPEAKETTEEEQDLFDAWESHLQSLTNQMEQLGRTPDDIRRVLFNETTQKAMFAQFVSQRLAEAENAAKKAPTMSRPPRVTTSSSATRHRVGSAPPPPTLSSSEFARVHSAPSTKAVRETRVDKRMHRLEREVARQAQAFQTLEESQQRHRETQHSALRRVFHRHELRSKHLFNKTSRSMQEQIVFAREFATHSKHHHGSRVGSGNVGVSRVSIGDGIGGGGRGTDDDYGENDDLLSETDLLFQRSDA